MFYRTAFCLTTRFMDPIRSSLTKKQRKDPKSSAKSPCEEFPGTEMEPRCLNKIFLASLSVKFISRSFFLNRTVTIFLVAILFSFLFLNLLAKIYVYFRNFSVSIILIQFLYECLSFFFFFLLANLSLFDLILLQVFLCDSFNVIVYILGILWFQYSDSVSVSIYIWILSI